MPLSDHSFFFTRTERETLHNLKADVYTNPQSLLTTIFQPIWKFMSTNLIPESVAPNTITVFGTVATMQAFHVTNQYYDEAPVAATAFAVVLLILSLMCSSLDGVHAKVHRSGTVLGDILVHLTHEVCHIFFVMTLFEVLEICEPQTRWYLMCTVEWISICAILLRINADTLRRGSKRANIALWLGYPFQIAELSFIEVMILVARRFFPASFFAISLDHARTAYMCAVVAALALAVLTSFGKRTSRQRILACLIMRVVPLYEFLPLYDTSNLTVIADALVVGTLVVEIYVSYTAERPLHAFVVVLCFTAHLNAVSAIVLCTLYGIGQLVDLCYTTNTPLFVPIRNVFIDGVFDLCHVGHKRLMENALKHGNRLIVGVLCDEDCVGYKRKPIMTTEERANEVRSCKNVSEVVEGSPVDGLTEEFIRKHNIHVVVHGEEYDKPEDHYYAVPRKMGITKIAPRTHGMSTSELIKRIVNSDKDSLAAKDKLSGKSSVKE